MQAELSFAFDANIQPISGTCSACGETMPAPPTHPRDSVDAILWFAHHFLVHKSLVHPTPTGATPDPESFA